MKPAIYNIPDYGATKAKLRPLEYHSDIANDLDFEEKKCCTCLTKLGQILANKTFTYYVTMLVALVGLVWQLVQIVSLYFQYETVTELRVFVPNNISAPSLSVCFPYQELADRQMLAKMFPQTNWTRDIKLVDLEDLVTIEDVFALTPEPDNLFKYCLFRKRKSFMRYQAKGQNCSKFFNVGKYYKQQYACYSFKLVEEKGFEDAILIENVQSSLVSSGMFFEVALDLELFAQVVNIQIIVHPTDVLPRGNKAFPVTVSRVDAVVNISQVPTPLISSYFFLSYSLFVNNLLPAPYTTNCLDYETVMFESQEECFDTCVFNQTITTKNKVPFTAIITDPIKYKHVSTKDNADDSFDKVMDDIKIVCAQTCSQPNCRDEIFVTKFIRSESYEYLSFRVYVANEPTLESTYKSKLAISDFLIYLMSCFGIWGGISMSGLCWSISQLMASLGRHLCPHRFG